MLQGGSRKGMTYFPWIVALINIFGCLLNARKNLWCWPIWIGTASINSWWYLFYRPDFPMALIWVSYIGFDAYGWYYWRKER
jgi:hypothetical protein